MRFQPDLFKQEAPPGLSLIEGFISPEEENSLLTRLHEIRWKNFSMYGVSANRKICPFGYDYDFSSGTLKPTESIPDYLLPILERVAHRMNVSPPDIKEVLYTWYPVGAGIGWHIDAPPFAALAGISLGNSCVMQFRKIGEEKIKKYELFLERRSAYFISHEARHLWQHQIKNLDSERFSITFRTLNA